MKNRQMAYYNIFISFNVLNIKYYSYFCCRKEKDIMKQYRNRVVDSLLAEKLEAMGAVLIEGPKYCGKTTTGEQQA